MAHELTAEVARELLTYDPDTGALTWKPRARCWFRSDRHCKAWNTRFAGTSAGHGRTDGYVELHLVDKKWLAHRVIFLLVHGRWPSQEVDHINGRKDDNRFSNLRDVSPSTNQENQRRPQKHNATGVLGVYRNGNRFCARIKVGCRKISVGSYGSADEAGAAYLAAKRRLHKGATL